ncbi:MAG TPA: magnesium transporter CorA family protein [Patescibacteria group bacterium]
MHFLNPLAKKTKTSSPEEKRSLVRKLKHNSITWIDIENPKRKEMNQLAEEFAFDPLHLDACIQKGQLDQLSIEDKYIFILLRTPRYDQQENKVTAHKVCIFLNKNTVVTVHRDSELSTADLFKEVESDEKRRDEVMKKSAAYLTYHLLEALVTDVSSLLDIILQEVDEIDDLVFDVNVSGAYSISQLRQKIMRQRRVISSFKTMLQDLSASKTELIDTTTRYYSSLTMRMKRLSETLEEARETVEIYKDADFTVSTERTNKILGILTIIFTLGIPATIVGSFYGMNILIPGGIEAGSWTFWGPFTTFYLVMVMAIGPAVLMLLLFKYKKWF